MVLILAGVFTDCQIAPLAKRTFLGVCWLLFRIFVGTVSDGFPEAAIQTFQLIGINRQIVRCKVIIFANQVAFFLAGILRAFSVLRLEGAIHKTIGVINSKSKD